MTSNPSVSVIVPVYRGIEYFSVLLRRLQQQTLSNIEIICIDDCGEDGTFELALSAAETDSRVICLRNEHNTGPGLCRNWGIREARGEFIAFADADDDMAPDFYERLYTTAVQEGRDAVKGRIKYMFDDGHYESGGLNQSVAKRVRGSVPLYHLCSWEHQSWIFRRSWVEQTGAVNADSRLGEDATFMLMVLYNLPKEKFAFQNDACYYYRKHSGSLSAAMSYRELVEISKSHREKIEYLMTQPANEWQEAYAVWQFESRIAGMLSGSLIRNTVTDEQAMEYLRVMREILQKYVAVLPIKKPREITRKMLQEGLSDEELLQYIKDNASRFDVTITTSAEMTEVEPQMEKETNVEVGIIAHPHEAVSACTLIHSLLKSRASGTHYHIHLFAQAWEGMWLDIVMNLRCAHADIQIYTDINSPTDLGNDEIVIRNRMTSAIRCSLPQRLQKIDKLLLLDPSCLVQKDVSSLYSLNMGNHYVAAVQDCPENWESVKSPKAGEVMSTAVLLMNLAQFRMAAKHAPSLEGFDIISEAYAAYRTEVKTEQMQVLHPRYNCGIARSWGEPAGLAMFNRLYGTHYCSYEEAASDAVVLSFCGMGQKAPWLDYTSPFRDLWLTCYRSSIAGSIPLGQQRKLIDELHSTSSVECSTKPVGDSASEQLRQENIRLRKDIEDLRRKLVEMDSKYNNLSILFNYKKICGRYWRYRVMSAVCWGKSRQKYKEKKRELRNLLRAIRDVPAL